MPTVTQVACLHLSCRLRNNRNAPVWIGLNLLLGVLGPWLTFFVSVGETWEYSADRAENEVNTKKRKQTEQTNRLLYCCVIFPITFIDFIS